MEVAIIDDDIIFQSSLRKKINEFNKSERHENIVADYFTGSSDFGKSTLEKYKIIISNVNLPAIQGIDLINSIREKTDAHFALMSKENGWHDKDILNDDRIIAIFDKNEHVKAIINWLKFMQARLAIYDCNSKIKSDYDECVNNIKDIKK